MKKVLIGVSSFLLVGLVTGCSNYNRTTSTTSEVTATTTSDKKQAEYDSAMAKGKEAIVDKDMSKAIAAFQLALEYNKDSKEAPTLIEQSKLYKEIVSLKEKKDYSKALKKLIELTDAEDGSQALKQYGKELTEEINKEVIKEREESKKESEKEAVPKKEVAETKTTAEETVTPKWNPQKKAELAAFMASWGTTMGQNYREYYPGNEVSFYGTYYPSVLNNNTYDGVPIQWSYDGMTANTHNVVGIYSDIDTAVPRKEMGNHLYLFVLYNGQPSVLITMQNQGNNENVLYFDQTQNADLMNGFAQIVGN